MTLPDGLRDRYATWRARLTQPYHVQVFEKIEERICTLSSGDRFLLYVFATIVSATSLLGVYALQQSILIKQPTHGGTLIEGEVGSPRYINPLLAISDADRDLVALTYMGLMKLSGDGTLELALAEDYSLSDDGKIYTFTLREGAKFSDGSPVTASDVVFTVRKAQDPALRSPEYANWSGVTVTAVDTRTVSFTLLKPYAPFLGLATLGILPSRLWQNIPSDEFQSSKLQVQPVGAGPFRLKSISYDDTGLIESASLVANQYYVFGKPYLDGIRFNFYSRNEDLADALSSGAVESAHGIATPGARTAPFARVFGVFWNQSEKQVYARIEVRKALSHALNREHITSTVLGGYATPIMGPVPPGGNITQVAVPSLENPTAAAAKILTDAGWVYDETMRVWKNASAKLTLDTITIRTSNIPELKNVATAVKTDWEKLGIPVTVELYEPGDLSQNIIRPRKYEALLYGMVIGRNQDLYAFWDSQERNDPGLNIALYANKTVDALLEDARSNTDAEVRTANLQKLEDIIAADYPAAFVYAPDFTYSVPSELQGVELPQIVTPADRFASVATWYLETDAVWPFLTSTK